MSAPVEPDDELDPDGSRDRLLPPDDRLWRHPSEVASAGGARGSTPSSATAVDTPSPPPEGRMWTVAILSGVIGALLATGVVYAVGISLTRHVTVPAVERDVDGRPVATFASAGSPNGFAVAAQHVQPSCAVLVARDAHGTQISLGVVFRSDGMVLTTAHTVDGAQTITASLGSKQKVPAHLVALDRGSDLAVVKLVGAGFVPAALGSALDLQIGDPVIAVGPDAEGDGCDVSGNQSFVIGVGQTLNAYGASIPDQLQVTTSAPPTTVGGPLVDQTGTVVGIATATGPPGQSAEWGTPVDLARDIANQLLATGHVVPVWLGVGGGDLSVIDALQLGVSGGAEVDKIYPHSPAAAAGIKAGDFVLGVNGHEVTSMANLIMAVHSLPLGSRVELDIERNGDPVRVTAVLTPRPKSIS
jgi:S1-C subfamily serine protease